MICLAAVALLSGCGVLQTLMQDEEGAADWIGGEKEKAVSATIPGVSGGNVMISLYFADETGTYLIKEERALPKTLSIARETVNQWIQGPKQSDGSAQALVPSSTLLLDIGIKEGVATVDLSDEFTRNYGKIPQELTVYGLVNTIAQFPSVNEVKVRIEGKAVSRVGSVDASSLTYKAGLVKGDSALGVQAGAEKALPTGSPSRVNLFGDMAEL
jgi:hypothetical protein